MSDSVVFAVAQKVRAFLEPRFHLTRQGQRESAGSCFDAAHVLAKVLTDSLGGEWLAVDGVWASPSVLARIEGGELTRWSEIEDAGQSHGWVRSGDGQLLVDITADQFGLEKVIVLQHPDERSVAWLVRSVLREDEVPRGVQWYAEYIAATA